MYIDRIEIVFEAGHRLLNYPGNCAAPHGHTYKIEVFAATRHLDALGMGIDFGELRRHLKKWVDQQWDHAFLLNDADTELVEALRRLPESKLYLFPGSNPSAEAIARELFTEARRQFGGVVQRVRVWESFHQYAEFIPADADI